jgi:hypothetical protein
MFNTHNNPWRRTRLGAASAAGIAAAAVTLTVGLASLTWWYTSAEQERSLENLCPASGHVGRHLTVLLDQSDPHGGGQVQALQTTLTRSIGAMRAADRITIYRLTAMEDRPAERLVDLCRPKRGAEADPSIENARLLERAYVRQFAQPLQQVLDELHAQGAPLRASPLIEALHAIANGPEMAAMADERQFVLASDLMQRSQLADAYTSRLASGLPGDAAQRQLPIEGVAVTIYLLRVPRLEARQADAAAFFGELLATATGSPPVFRTL